MANKSKIETDRLLLWLLSPDDAEAMAAFVVENRSHFAPWEPIRDDAYFTETYWRNSFQESRGRNGRVSTLRFVFSEKTATADGPIVGQCTFSQIVRGAFHAAYLGYGLDHRFVGLGLMQEALRKAIDFSFHELNLHRIMANYMPSNERSARLLNRLGFAREGYAHDYLLIAGKWEDHVLTALTNDNWVGHP